MLLYKSTNILQNHCWSKSPEMSVEVPKVKGYVASFEGIRWRLYWYKALAIKTFVSKKSCNISFPAMRKKHQA
jgi:hypothetical protein